MPALIHQHSNNIAVYLISNSLTTIYQTVNYKFRKATEEDLDEIWPIFEGAIRRRKEDGSEQWQGGYPNPDVIRNDMQQGIGHVLTDSDKIIAYTALPINDEPAYDNIDGEWLTNGDFICAHRVAVSDDYLGKGIATEMLKAVEDYGRQNGIYSVKADTNFDNPAMMRVFDKLGYKYCGEVMLRGAPRRAYEKVLDKA